MLSRDAKFLWIRHPVATEVSMHFGVVNSQFAGAQVLKGATMRFGLGVGIPTAIRLPSKSEPHRNFIPEAFS